MKRIALLLVVFVLGLASAPAAQINAGRDNPELVGVYKCEGRNPDGKPYAGVVEIVNKGRLFQLRWTLESGEQTYGFGFVHDGALVVTVFGDPRGEPMAPTVAVYSVAKGNPLTLDGEWAVIVAQGIHSEKLTKMPKDHPATAKKPLPKPTHKL